MAGNMAIDIAEWLASLGLGAYAQAFHDNHIEADTLSSLTMDDLREIGVASVGHRRRILAGIESLGRAKPGSAAAAMTEDLASERRQVTVLFADIAGFSSLSAEIDAERVHALLSSFYEHVDRMISDFGGRIDKHIGDCVMAVFGAPVAHSDDVRRAVASALAIHAAMDQVSEETGQAIRAHVGIASGEVVASSTGSSRHTEYTVTGETVNLASRLTGLAQDGETVASADIITTLAEAVEAEFGGSQPIRGLAVPVDIWRVQGLKDRAEHHLSLVGRNAEFAQCVAALDATRNGDTGIVLYVRGEAGIGKSCLAAETLRKAGQLGFTSLSAAMFDFGAGLERDPLRTLATALLGSVAAPLTTPEALAAFAETMKLAQAEILALKDLVGVTLSPDERRRLDAMSPAARVTARGEALAGLAIAAARRNPLLVVLEDVHWADAVTLQGLAAMARAACGTSRTVVAITSRIEGDPIPSLRPLIDGPPMVLIELGRLRDQDAHALAAGLLDADNPLIEQCVARADGNPLFLEQLIRHATTGGLASAVPGSIRSVVAAQVDRLAASERAALQAAAVLGDQFSTDALRHLLGRPDWNPMALIASRLVRPEKETLQFTHDLVREGIYGSILNTERQRLHRVAAGWFADRDGVLHAEHLARAEDPAAVTAYLVAAEGQIAAYRLEEALSLLERAAGTAREPSDRATVSIRQGDLLSELGKPVEALAAYEQALATTSDAETAARAKLGKAGALRLVERNDEALALLEEAEPVLLAEGRLAELARLEHLRGNLYFPLGQVAACQAAHERALDYAERSGSMELKASALGGLGDAALASGRLVTAEQRFAECVDLACRHGFGRIEVANAPMLAVISSYAEPALTAAERAIAAASAACQPRAELIARQVAMILHLLCARPEAVEAHFERAQDIVRQLGSRRYLAMNLTLMAEAHRQLGDRARAAPMHEEALAIIRESGMSYLGAIVLGYRALAAYHDQNLRRASMREGEQVLAKDSVATSALHFYSCAIESCLLAEDWGEARRLADGLAARFTIETVPLVEFLVERARLLAELGESGPSAPLVQSLQRCRSLGRELGYSLFLKLLDKALADTAG